MADLITTDDLESIPGGGFTDDQSDQVEFLIRFASAYVRRRIPAVDDDIESGALSRDLVVGVVGAAIVRAMDTAEAGPNVKSVQYPEVSTEYFDRDSAPTALFYLTAEELDLLTTADDDGTSGAFMIRVG